MRGKLDKLGRIRLIVANMSYSCLGPAGTVVEQAILFSGFGIPERMKVDRGEHAVESRT